MKRFEAPSSKRRQPKTWLWVVVAVALLAAVLWLQNRLSSAGERRDAPAGASGGALSGTGPQALSREQFNQWILGAGISDPDADLLWFAVDSVLDGRVLSEGAQIVLSENVRTAVTTTSPDTAEQARQAVLNVLREAGVSDGDLPRVERALTRLGPPTP